MSEEVINNLTVTNNSSELNMYTVNQITCQGITYKPQFTSEGLRIPIPFSIKSDDKDEINHSVFYLSIPKEEIVKCLKEYLPELYLNLQARE